MKKFVFAFLALSAASAGAVIGQTNPPAAAPSVNTPSGPLTPPPDSAPATATVSPSTPVVTPTAVAPTPSAPAVQAAPPAPVVVVPPPAPVHVAPRPAPPAQVVVIAPQPARHVRRPYHLTPVAWIVATRDKLHDDDRYVTIIGHVTRRIGDNEYWFTDGTGSVRLDSDNFDLPIGRRLVIGGRIDQAWLGIGHLEVDVVRWRNDR